MWKGDLVKWQPFGGEDFMMPKCSPRLWKNKQAKRFTSCTRIGSYLIDFYGQGCAIVIVWSFDF